MKKTLALLALTLGLVASVSAGSLSTKAIGQGGGKKQYDATNLQEVVEVEPRGWSWTRCTEYSPLSGVSSAINVSTGAGVGAASGYYGPVAVRIQNVDVTTAVVYTTRTATATGDTVTAMGIRLQPWSTTAGQSSAWNSGPLAQGEHVHLRGQTATTKCEVCFGHVNN